MFKSNFIITVLLSIIPTTCLWSFEAPSFEQAFEALIAQKIEPIEYNDLYEHLWELYQHPLNLNEANQEDLIRLGILTNNQIHYFFSHLAQNGPLVSIYELQAIPEFDLKTIYLILPFVYIPEFYPLAPDELKELGLKTQKQGYWLGRYERTLETKKGYQIHPLKGVPTYVGSPDQLMTRLKYSHPRGWSLGLAGRKNAGEAFTWDHANSRYIFNVYNAYLLLQNKGFFKQVLLGDYQIGYGQGLIVNAGFSMDKRSDAIPSIRTNNIGIKPYASFGTDRLRGAAITLNWKNFIHTIYYAYNLLDARVQTDPNTNKQYVSSISRNNLYRTQTALDKKDQVVEQVIGSTWAYQNQKQGFELGINTVYHTYDLPIQPDTVKYPHSFSGQHQYNTSLFYRYLWYNLHFFGEGAISKSGGKALIAGVVASLSAKADASLLVRHYDPHFHSFYGKAFRKNSTANSNEQGIYIGLSFQPIKRIRLHTYYDYFRFPKPTRTIAEPTSGYDWLTKITYQPNRQTLWLLQHILKSKAKNTHAPLPTNKKKQPSIIKQGYKNKLKTQFKHAFNRQLDMITDIQWSHYQLIHEPTWGYGIMQQATYRIRQWNITGQITWFDTDQTNKLYFGEKNVLYSPNIPTAYQQTGFKYVFFLAYKPNAAWRFELRYKLTWLLNKPCIGSGLETIEGNKKNEIKLQILYQF